MLSAASDPTWQLADPPVPLPLARHLLPVHLPCLTTARTCPPPTPPLAQACNTRALPHASSSRISAVHADAALADLAAPTAFPPLPRLRAVAPATLAGAWALRQQAAAPAPALSADAEDVAPRPPVATAAPYVLPARRQGAPAAILAGCALAYPALAQPAQRPAPYVAPHRRTTEQQVAAAEAGRPGRICAFPSLTAGPLPQPAAEAPLPLYRLALLFPSQPC